MDTEISFDVAALYGNTNTKSILFFRKVVAFYVNRVFLTNTLTAYFVYGSTLCKRPKIVYQP